MDVETQPAPAAPPGPARSHQAPAEAPGTGNPDAVVVVPMFNEATVIHDVVHELRQHFATVVCVDDGSSDGSATVAAAAGAQVVSHPTNLGQGAALQTGLTWALRTPASFFVTYDADGQHSTVDALAMLDAARRGEVDIVLGSRFLSGTDESMPRSRRAVLRAGIAFTRLTTGLRLTDTHNGLRVMNRHAARLLELRLHGMAHSSELLSAVARHSLRYVELPSTIRYTEYSLAKGQPSINAFNIVVDLMLERVRYAR